MYVDRISKIMVIKKTKFKKEKETYITHSRIVIESLSIYNNTLSVNRVRTTNNNNHSMLIMKRNKIFFSVSSSITTKD